MNAGKKLVVAPTWVLVPLPEKLSQAFRTAIAECDRLIRGIDSEYSPWSEEWHEPNRKNGKCNICIAGALIARTIKDPQEGFDVACLDDDFSTEDALKLKAIDDMRMGRIRRALMRWYRKIPSKDTVERLDALGCSAALYWGNFREWEDCKPQLRNRADIYLSKGQ